jgi:hypothetical protein
MIKKINYIKFLYTMLQYRTSQNEFLASWTFELQEMLPKKCSLERGKRQKSLMRTNGLMNWQCSTEQMLIFSGESKLHWESQFHSISETWQEEATTEAPSEAGARLPDFRFFWIQFGRQCDVKKHVFFGCPIPHVVASVNPVKLVANLSQGCPAPRAVREVQSAQPPVDPPVAPEEPTEQPTAEPMGLRQRRGKGRRNGMCTDVLESPVSNISRECKLSRRTPQTPIWPFLEIEKPVNEPICFLCMVRSYKEPPSVS